MKGKTDMTKTIKLDKIASSTITLDIPDEVELIESVEAKEGNVLVVRALREKNVYNQLELVDGEMAPIRAGDVFAGVLGARRALHGFVGHVPEAVRVGDTLQVLNLGGTLGICTSANASVGEPLPVEVLGSVRINGDATGPNIRKYGIPWRDTLPECRPIVMISGTCMNSGKTTAAAKIVEGLTASGYRVGAAKLAGVALMRDINKMRASGAVNALCFVHAGLPSTVNREHVVPAAKGVLHELSKNGVDVLVVELGDGILGGYGVSELLADAEIKAHTAVSIACANDPVGAWGIKKILHEEYGIRVDVISGPATDNQVGVEFVQGNLGVRAANGLHGDALPRAVREILESATKI